MDCAINAPIHGNNVVERTNATEKRYLKEQTELIGKLASNNTIFLAEVGGCISRNRGGSEQEPYDVSRRDKNGKWGR